MSDRTALPSGAWIELRDPATLRRGDKKRIMKGVQSLDAELGVVYDLSDGLLQVLTIAWSYDLPLPSESPESLDLLPIEDDQALLDLLEPAQKLLFPQPPEATPAQRADPASPTEPSAG
ncbi:hypothetical protein ABZ883_40585 [Streptomyces sp. NPDC046977]|uniref:hypothetical protein n=1 Tax=Streptomyces sp. NPDC046977 TaxID=3154703 RepID=UPI0033CBFA99